MNYLAHFQLAGPQPAMIHGALLGDFVKGPLRGDYDTATEQGIALHRHIDGYCDRDETLRQLIKQFPTELQRYGGIVTDVLFDHYLTIHWQQFHDAPLQNFAREIYARIETHQADWPNGAQRFSRRLIEHDLLNQYQYWDTIQGVLRSIGKRLTRQNPLDHATELVAPHLDKVEATFLALYPDLQRFAEHWRHSSVRP